MLTLARPFEYSEEIRKSRFVARACSSHIQQEAVSFLESVRDADASHNCWAYRIGMLYRFSDDGEPGGTAGRPILSAIERQGVDNVTVVVTRFFGGIKLGAGGLIRAYGGVTAKCLQNAPLREIRTRCRVSLIFGYEHVGAVHLVLDQRNLEPEVEEYLTDGISIRVLVDQVDLEDLRAAIGNASRGSAQFTISDHGSRDNG